MHLRKSSWYTQKFILATLIEVFGSLKTTELTAALVDEFKRERLADGLKPASVNNELRVLRRVRNFAKERGIAFGDLRFKMLKEGQRRAQSWTEIEVAQLLKACRVGDKLRLRRAKREAERRPRRHAEKFGTATLAKPAILPLVTFLANTGCRKERLLL